MVGNTHKACTDSTSLWVQMSRNFLTMWNALDANKYENWDWDTSENGLVEDNVVGRIVVVCPFLLVEFAVVVLKESLDYDLRGVSAAARGLTVRFAYQV